MNLKSRTTQVILIMLVWAAALIVVDRVKNVRVPTISEAAMGRNTPQVTVVLNHYCCSGCWDTVAKALEQFPWLGKPQKINGATTTAAWLQTPATIRTAQVQYGGGLVASIPADQMGSVDLAKLDRSIRDAGLVPQQIRVSGIPQFKLIAHLPHFCCAACVQGAHDVFAPDNPAAAMKLMGEIGVPTVDKAGQTVTMEFRGSADAAQFERYLVETGFQPDSIMLLAPVAK